MLVTVPGLQVLTMLPISFLQISDPALTHVTHIMVDEIHERGRDEDFLLIVLRDILPKRPDLRLVSFVGL